MMMFKQWGRGDSVGLTDNGFRYSSVTKRCITFLCIPKKSTRLNNAVACYGRCLIPTCFPLIRKQKSFPKRSQKTTKIVLLWCIIHDHYIMIHPFWAQNPHRYV
jgi:hypothetical protein